MYPFSLDWPQYGIGFGGAIWLSAAVENWTDAALEKWTPLTIGE